MTKVYNVTTFGIASQLKSKLEYIKRISEKDEEIEMIANDIKNNLKKGSYSFYLCPGIQGLVYLTPQDIYKIAEVINDQIFVLFPSLNSIYTYLIEISKLMILLEIPLSWITPSGLKFTQHYLKSKQTKLAIKIFGKTKKRVLKESIDKLNKTKKKIKLLYLILFTH